MNKKQWKAVYDFCEENGFERPSELLQDLKMKGVVDKQDTMDDLVYYPHGSSYDDMYNWLQENAL